MRKLKSWLALVLVFSLLCPLRFPVFAKNPPASAYAQVNEVVYAVAPVNIRTGAGTEHPIIGALKTGKPIRRIAVGGNRWSQVVYRGETAYIHSSYLTTVCPKELQNEEFMIRVSRFHELKDQDYTAQSWKKVTDAVDEGCEALRAEDLTAVAGAALELGNAIEALVPMNYEQLQSALDQLPSLGEDRRESELWLALLAAQQKGKELLSSGDQAAVDAVYREIEDLLTQLEELPQPEPEVIIQQVPVESPSAGEACDHSDQGVWKGMLIAGGAVMVLLAVAAGVFLYGKKRRHRDHTPLVDYDISDDA